MNGNPATTQVTPDSSVETNMGWEMHL